jgi:hypothetical protein
MVRNSFDDNTDQLVPKLMETFQATVKFASLVNLNSAVVFLKKINHQKDSQQLIEFFMENRGNEKEIFNLKNYPFAEDINDPDLRSIVEEKFETFKDDRSPMEVMFRLGTTDSWSQEDVALLTSLSVDQVYDIFKNNPGPNLSKIVRGCLKFKQIQHADENLNKIVATAEEALLRIAMEFPLNAVRVSAYGIEIRED